MTDPNRRALFVDGVESLPPEVLEDIIGHLATFRLVAQVLPRTDIRILAEKEDKLAQLLNSLPDDVEYGYFGYDELRDFAREFFAESGRSTESVIHVTGLLWSTLTTRLHVGVTTDPSTEPVRHEAPSHALNSDLKNPRYRGRFFASLSDSVAGVKVYHNQYRGIGRDSTELFANFTLSRIPRTDAVE